MIGKLNVPLLDQYHSSSLRLIRRRVCSLQDFSFEKKGVKDIETYLFNMKTNGVLFPLDFGKHRRCFRPFFDTTVVTRIYMHDQIPVKWKSFKNLKERSKSQFLDQQNIYCTILAILYFDLRKHGEVTQLPKKIKPKTDDV